MICFVLEKANPVPTLCFFIQLLEFLLSSFMHSDAVCFFHLLVLSPAFSLLDIRVICPACTAGLVEQELFGLVGCKAGNGLLNKQVCPLLLSMLHVVLSE